MTTAGDASLVRVLQNRNAVLALLTDGALAKPQLVDQLDVSRSTVDRAIRELEENTLVQRRNGEFTATLSGRLAYDAYCEFHDQISAFTRTSDLLSLLDADVEIAPCMLTGAEIVKAEPPAPHKPVSRLKRYFERATGIRTLAQSITSPRLAKQVYEATTERGVHFEGVYPESAIEYLRSERWSERHEMVASGNFRAYQVEYLPFGLMLFEEPGGMRVCLNIYDEISDIRGVIVNDDPKAVAWGESVFESYRDAAIDITETFA